MADAFPGSDLVDEGLRDLARGVETVPAMLVAMGSPRLRALGVTLPREIADAHLKLYALLAKDLGDGAHSRYNALVRRLVSYMRARECASP